MTTVTREQREELRNALRQQFPTRERTYLLPALHELHHRFGYLPAWALEVVGWHLRIPASEVYGAATSYTELRTKQPGKHLLRVCTGLTCYLQGGQRLLEGLSAALKVKPQETTSDGEYTLEETPCVFLCAMAPVVERDHRLVGRVSLDSFGELLSGVNAPKTPTAAAIHELSLQTPVHASSRRKRQSRGRGV